MIKKRVFFLRDSSAHADIRLARQEFSLGGVVNTYIRAQMLSCTLRRSKGKKPKCPYQSVICPRSTSQFWLDNKVPYAEFLLLLTLWLKKALPGVSTKWRRWWCISCGSQGKLLSWWEEREGLTAWDRAGWIQHSSDAFLNSQTHSPFVSLPCPQTLALFLPGFVIYSLKEARLALKPPLSSPTAQAWFMASMKERRGQQAFGECMPSLISLSHPGG